MATSTYYVGYIISEDQDFRYRLTVSAQQEAVAQQKMIGDPEQWVVEHRWIYSAQQAWIDKVVYALDSGKEDWGKDAAVITDQDILSWVQPEVAKELSYAGS